MTATQEPGNGEETQAEEEAKRAEDAAEEARVHQEHRNVDETSADVQDVDAVRESMRVETSEVEEEVTPEDNP